MSSLRSTKDLKGIVENSRKITFSNSNQLENESEIGKNKIEKIIEADETNNTDDKETFNSRLERKIPNG